MTCLEKSFQAFVLASEKIAMEKILFISLSCVGDAVMTTPVLQALHLAHPSAKIDVVADRRSKDVFINCPYLGSIYYKEKNKFLRGGPSLLGQLFRQRYKLIVDLRTDGLAYLLRAEKKLTKFGASSYGLHAVESLMGIIRPLHGHLPIPPTHIWLDETNIETSNQMLGALTGKRLLAIGPGCGGRRPEKFWPTDYYAKLSNSLADVFEGVVFVGGEQDVPLARKISNQLQLPFLDTCGATEIIQAAAILSQVSMFVGSDSGLGHVAGAVGTPTLTFFSVDKPERCLPWGPSPHWLVGKHGDARNIPVDAAEAIIRTAISG
jgi:heptosyltransferase-3